MDSTTTKDQSEDGPSLGGVFGEVATTAAEAAAAIDGLPTRSNSNVASDTTSPDIIGPIVSYAPSIAPATSRSGAGKTEGGAAGTSRGETSQEPVESDTDPTPTPTSTPRPKSADRTGLASRLLRPHLKLESKPDAFLTVVQSARVMNMATTEGSAVSKAAFYDNMLASLQSGNDENLALSNGVKAAKMADEERKKRKEAVMVGEPNAASQGSADIANAPPPTPSNQPPSTPTPTTPLAKPLTESTPPHASTDSLASTDLPATTKGKLKLRGLFDRMIKPSVAAHADDSLIDSAMDGKGTSMAHLRVLHKKVCMTVEEYDAMTHTQAVDREKSMHQSFKSALLKAETEVRSALKAEYEDRIKHDECNARISVLTRENNIMVDETTRTMALNKQLQSEVEALRIFKSSAESEQRMMVEELARRRLQTRAMREKLREVNGRLSVLEAREKSDEGEVTQAVSVGEPIGEATSKVDDALEVEWEEWCRAKQFNPSRWNISTAPGLLATPPPPSVIHCGDTNDDVDAGEARCSRPHSAGVLRVVPEEDGSRKAFLKHVHAACRAAQGKLRRRVAREEARRRRILTDWAAHDAVLTRIADTIQQRAGIAPSTNEAISRASSHDDVGNDAESHLEGDLNTPPKPVHTLDLTTLQSLIDELRSHSASLHVQLTGTASSFSDDTSAYDSESNDSDSHIRLPTSPPTHVPPPRTRPVSARPRHRPSSAPLTGFGAGIPTTEALLSPTAFARPRIATARYQTDAARAAREAGVVDKAAEAAEVVLPAAVVRKKGRGVDDVFVEAVGVRELIGEEDGHGIVGGGDPAHETPRTPSEKQQQQQQRGIPPPSHGGLQAARFGGEDIAAWLERRKAGGEAVSDDRVDAAYVPPPTSATATSPIRPQSAPIARRPGESTDDVQDDTPPTPANANPHTTSHRPATAPPTKHTHPLARYNASHRGHVPATLKRFTTPTASHRPVSAPSRTTPGLGVGGMCVGKAISLPVRAASVVPGGGARKRGKEGDVGRGTGVGGKTGKGGVGLVG